MQTINMALLGFGFNGQRVASLFQDGFLVSDGVRLRLAAIVEQDAAKLALAGFQCPDAMLYADVAHLLEALAALDITLLKLGFPIFDDATLDELAALEAAGVRVVSEKPAWFPFAPASRNRDLKPWVNFPERFNTVLLQLAQSIDLDGTELICSRINTLYHDNLTARARKSVVGGCLFDKSIHDVDLIVGLLGAETALKSVGVERVHVPDALPGIGEGLLSLRSWDSPAIGLGDAAEGYCRVHCIFESPRGSLNVTLESSWIGPDECFDQNYLPANEPQHSLSEKIDASFHHAAYERYNRKTWFVRSGSEQVFANIQHVGSARPFISRRGCENAAFFGWRSPQCAALLCAANTDATAFAESRLRSALAHELTYEIWMTVRSAIIGNMQQITFGAVT